MRRLLIVAVLVVAALGAVIVVARWAAPLFGATGGPSWGTKTVYPLDHTEAIRDEQRRRGTSGGAVETMSFGIVGFIRAATGHWLENGGRASLPREALIALITSTFTTSVADAVDGTASTQLVTA